MLPHFYRLFCRFVIVMIAACTAVPVGAEPVAVVCKMKAESGEGIMENILFAEDQNGIVHVFDAMINYGNNKQPLRAIVTKNTSDLLDFSWTVVVPSTQSQKIKVKARAQYNRRTQKIQINANLVEFRQNSFARGTCSKR
ncbi:MAG: hypothetical protein N4A53_02235 [Pelagimonas sp.]|nr:hypothetical protein [Pelagimonas sp.]